jgi:menaquinone-dependent protoporphyrinogen oxidase
MTTKVLVAYASKMGSTAGIAEAAANRLHEAGIYAEVRAVDDVLDVSAYDAVLIGSAVYLSRWRPEAIAFLRRLDTELAERQVWLFQSGPLDESAERRDLSFPRAVRRLADRIGVRGFVTFGGRIDADHAVGFAARRMADAGLAKDHRDFDRIRAWADAIAAELGCCAPEA